MSDIDERLKNIQAREEACWRMVELYTEARDPHGVMDMGCEIQALQRAKQELGRVK